jgi:hypothetical protein
VARMSLTAGELTLDLSDRSPWLSRRRLRAWEEAIHCVLESAAMGALGELTSTTELADLDGDDVASGCPEIGFRGSQP